MGGDNSKTNDHEDFYTLEHLSKISLKNRKLVSYYFITSKNESNIDQTISELRKYFKIDHFQTIKTLKQQLTFVHKLQLIKVIVLPDISKQDLKILEQESKIAQIIIFGKLNQKNEKLIQCQNNVDKLIVLLNQLEQKDKLQISSYNILLLNQQDTKMLNKYRLNYHCNTVFQGRVQAKKDFIQLARKLYPQQKDQIEQFENQYNLQLQGKQKRNMILDWVFKQNFYWQLVNNLTRNTTDPKRLAYIRLALKDIFQTIQSEHKQNKKYAQAYIVIDLTEDQINKLSKSKNSYLLFTSFVKGFTNQKSASNYAKLHQNTKFFKFVVSSYKGQLPQNLDFGYVIRDVKENQPNIIFNIYNVFKIQQINKMNGQLQYGMLPLIWKMRRQEDFRSKMTKQDLDLVRNYDYLQDLIQKADSQATLLQISGYLRQSADLYDKKVDFIRSSNQSQNSINKTIIRKADALRFIGQFDQAQNELKILLNKTEKQKSLAYIHLAQIYIAKNEEQNFEKTIKQLQPLIKILQNNQNQQYFKGMHLIAIKMIKNGNSKKAKQMLEGILNKLSVVYDVGMEGKPIVHEIYRTLATCKSKLGHHEDALKLLNSTLELQLVCEGKTHNVAFTQNLIQTVSKSSGNIIQLQKSQKRMKQLQNQIESGEQRISTSAVSLNKSLFSIIN